MAALLGVALILYAIDGGVTEEPPAPPPDEVAEEAHENPPEPIYTVWDRLAACESTSNWSANTRNGYYGGLQMDMTFWRNYGGQAFATRPDLASRAAQIAVAERGLVAQGWRAWPSCSRRLGLR